MARAEAYYRQALELCPPGTCGRSRVVAKVGRAAFQAGRVAEAAGAYEEAIAGFAAEGDVVGQGGVVRNRHGLLTARAALAESDRAPDQAALRYDEAAACWADYGHRLERGRALLGAGRCLLALGRPEARLRLQDARAVLASLNAEPLLAEVDAALGNATGLRHSRRR